MEERTVLQTTPVVTALARPGKGEWERRVEARRERKLAAYLYGALVFLPVVVTPYTWLAFLRLPPAGSGLTGCLLEEYCHAEPGAVVRAQLPGLIYFLLPLIVLLMLSATRGRGVTLAGLATLLGGARFGLPLVVWLAGLHWESAVPLRALFSYCATESACQVQPGFAYYFVTPLEALSGLISLILYVVTVTIWLHLVYEPERTHV